MKKTSAGAALVARLGDLGVDYIFANSGTDFPPIIEGLAEAAATAMPLPQTIICPHETAAMGMAHGAYFATQRAQAVMVHTNVGLANAAMGAINARADNVPMLVFSGRTPTLEAGRFGARTVPIGWGQEMFDQGALVREASKWTYELRYPEQVHDMVERAHAIATSTPRGPVYMSLPRETLCEDVALVTRPVQMNAAQSAPRPDDIRFVANALANAKFPVIFAQRGAGSIEAFDALRAMVDTWAIPVCQYWAVQLALATDHPMATPHDPGPLLAQADVILVLDALAPWAPEDHAPREDATVIQMGQDPLFAQTPVRNFRADIAMAGDLSDGILALAQAMKSLDPQAYNPTARAARQRAITTSNSTSRRARHALTKSDLNAGHLTKRVISAALSDALATGATVFSELGAQLEFMEVSRADGWFESPHSGGLGFGFPAAMGYALAQRDHLTIATLGDGSYMFANPVACHQIAESLNLSMVVIILNNAAWGAVRNSVLGMYPEGHAARANQVPLTELSPSPDFAKTAQASRAFAQSVSTPEDFSRALAAAVEHAENGRGLALIDAQILRD